MTISARSTAFEKGFNNLNLISRDQGRCMATIFYDVRRRVTVSTQHSCEDVFREKIRSLPLYHQDRNVDRVPIFPQVHAVVPGIAERVGNTRVAQ